MLKFYYSVKNYYHDIRLNFPGKPADTIIPRIAAKEGRMNISPIATATSRSIEDMGNLLKNITDSSIGLQDKLIKVGVTEKVSDEKLGRVLDLMA